MHAGRSSALRLGIGIVNWPCVCQLILTGNFVFDKMQVQRQVHQMYQSHCHHEPSNQNHHSELESSRKEFGPQRYKQMLRKERK